MPMPDTDTYLNDENDILTPGEVAAAYNVALVTVRRWDRAGHLKSFRTLGNQRRFRRSENPQIPTAPTSPEDRDATPRPAPAIPDLADAGRSSSAA